MDEALRPSLVIITKNSRDRNVLISASAFKTLVRERIPRRMEDLDDETLQGIAAAEVPAHFACLDKIDLGGLGLSPAPTCLAGKLVMIPPGRVMRHGFRPDTGFKYMLKNGRKGSGI